MTMGRAAAIAAVAATLMVAAIIGGMVGLAYLVVYAAATLPGWPIGFALFGKDHPAGWIAGAVIGYGITAVALWIPIAAHVAGPAAFLAAWGICTGASWWLIRWNRPPAVGLPPWTTGAAVALCAIVMLVPLLVATPFNRIGESDGQGNRRYRAYFTADFVWHEALTAELARFSSPPRNPYLGGRSLDYYWAYFLLPAAVTGAGPAHTSSPPIEIYLGINSLGTGVLFVALLYLSAWSAAPRAIAAGTATGLVLLAASAEGLYAAIDLIRRGRPLDHLRYLNIDAVTSWRFEGLTIDGLPRSIWYNPHHSLACAAGLIALIIAGRVSRPIPPAASAGVGLSLGLALILSPFPGGAMTLIYAIVTFCAIASAPRTLLRAVVDHMPAAVLIVAALGWCVVNDTFEGANDALEFGLSSRAGRSPAIFLGLALGPILLLVAIGWVVAAARRFPQSIRPAAIGIAVALGLLFFVTLTVEPIWIGWRAGQILLVTCPALIALALARMHDTAGRPLTAVVVVMCGAIGLPTTLIDYYNAQDVTNEEMANGFHWTVVLSPGEQEALRWIELNTPADSLVQMSLEPRGRETWSLIPSFARRRMAAGLPISLLRTGEYEDRANRADALFSAGNAVKASVVARSLRVDYVYVGRAEREAFGDAVDAFDERPDLFAKVFENDEASVYELR